MIIIKILLLILLIKKIIYNIPDIIYYYIFNDVHTFCVTTLVVVACNYNYLKSNRYIDCNIIIKQLVSEVVVWKITIEYINIYYN